MQALLNDYINKACTLAANLGLLEAPPANGGSGVTAGAKPPNGNEASSAPPKRAAPATTVPMSNIFARLLWDIPAQGATTTILPAVECSIDTVLPAV